MIVANRIKVTADSGKEKRRGRKTPSSDESAQLGGVSGSNLEEPNGSKQLMPRDKEVRNIKYFLHTNGGKNKKPTSNQNNILRGDPNGSTIANAKNYSKKSVKDSKTGDKAEGTNGKPVEKARSYGASAPGDLTGSPLDTKPAATKKAESFRRRSNYQSFQQSKKITESKPNGGNACKYHCEGDIKAPAQLGLPENAGCENSINTGKARKKTRRSKKKKNGAFFGAPPQNPKNDEERTGALKEESVIKDQSDGADQYTGFCMVRGIVELTDMEKPSKPLKQDHPGFGIIEEEALLLKGGVTKNGTEEAEIKTKANRAPAKQDHPGFGMIQEKDIKVTKTEDPSEIKDEYPGYGMIHGVVQDINTKPKATTASPYNCSLMMDDEGEEFEDENGFVPTRLYANQAFNNTDSCVLWLSKSYCLKHIRGGCLIMKKIAKKGVLYYERKELLLIRHQMPKSKADLSYIPHVLERTRLKKLRQRKLLRFLKKNANASNPTDKTPHGIPAAVAADQGQDQALDMKKTEPITDNATQKKALTRP